MFHKWQIEFFFIENTLIRQLKFNKIKFITLWTTNEKRILVLFLQDNYLVNPLEIVYCKASSTMDKTKSWRATKYFL